MIGICSRMPASSWRHTSTNVASSTTSSTQRTNAGLLAAGTIVGSGTVSNRGDDGPGRPVAEGGAGYSCIVEQRTVETLLHGAPKTPFLAFGDTVRIEMHDRTGLSVFGAIEQTVTPYPRLAPA